MIVVIIISAALFLALVVWLSFRRLDNRIDTNGQCPACGHRGMALKYRRHQDKPQVACTCRVCDFAWFVDVVGDCQKPII